MKKSILITSALAAVSAASAQTVLDGTITEINDLGGGEYAIAQDYTFPAETILTGTTYVASGVTVTINAGSIVRGQPVGVNADTTSDPLDNVPGALVVSRGGEVVIAGTATNPVIFTTAADTTRDRWESGDTFLDADPVNAPLPPFVGTDANAALWGALSVCGFAPTNCGPDATGTAGENFIEGFPNNSFRNTYGGSLPNDSSGSIRFVSIRHSGRTLVEGKEQQGLTLGGVGAGTVIENVDIYCSGDDGIEIFGGTANLRNVMISYVNDDGFDLDQGWTGNAQNVFVLASNLADTPDIVETASVAEWDGEDGNTDGADNTDTSGELTFTGQPFTAPTMYNFTFFCDGVSGTAVTIDTSFGGNLYNSVFFEIPDDGFLIENTGTGNPVDTGFPSQLPFDRLLAGSFNINGVHFISPAGQGATAAAVGADATSDGVIANDQTFALNSTTNVHAVGNPFFYGAATGNVYNDQDAANGLNPVPLNGATSSVVPVVGPFFETAGYRGAFPQDSTGVLWTTGWTAMNTRGILVDAGNGSNVVAP